MLPNFSAQNEEETKVDFGSGYLFDTNGMHAGCFRPSSEPRMIVCFEFSSGKDFFPGKVGPGCFSLTSGVFQRLRELGCIRANRVKRVGRGELQHIGAFEKKASVGTVSIS